MIGSNLSGLKSSKKTTGTKAMNVFTFFACFLSELNIANDCDVPCEWAINASDSESNLITINNLTNHNYNLL